MPETNNAIVAGVRVSTDHYIGGQRVPSAQRFEDISPIDGAVIAPVTRGGATEVNAAVAAAKAAFPAWAALGPHGRLPYLEKLAHIIEARVPDLAAVETTNNGSLHAASGTRHCTALFALAFDRTMVPAPGSKLLEGLPDFDVTFPLDEVRPSWEDDNTGVVVGDAYFHGEPLPHAPRNVLKKAISDWAALGYTVEVGIELEAFVMQPDEHGGWTEWNTPGAYVYGTGPAVDPVGLFNDLMETADKCGLPIESLNSEYDTPQSECFLIE